jgi:L-seryl-tRNA(Ser) seleniumtransferase
VRSVDSTALRALPSIDEVLKSEAGRAAVADYGRPTVVAAARGVLDEARAGIRAGGAPPDPRAIGDALTTAIAREAAPNVRAVFNLTGTVLHTNLGRAVLAEAAIEAATTAMREAIALEFDLGTGKRGERDALVRGLLCELTGAEDATLVNNNAAALMIVLNTLARGREAVVSRGELIEIGGAFRLPDIMERSGVRLVEIGTTNRTHPRDYEGAIGPETGLVLKVHTSNFLIQGFTTAVDAPALAGIARKADVPFVNDLGSGTLVDLRRFGLAHEPTVAEAVSEGADLVTFSGDKLLGGPQAGFVVGRRDLVQRINKNPMKRAMRVDKLRLAAIEATLRLYRDPDRLTDRLPTMRFLARSAETIRAVAERMAAEVREALGDGIAIDVAPCASQIGSGALPLATLPSFALRIATLRTLSPLGRGRVDEVDRVRGSDLSAECGTPSPCPLPTGERVRGSGGGPLEALAAAFRGLPRPVIGRIEDGAFLLDCRCLEDEAGFAANLRALKP